jgi:nucleotide-binding universal stress UspA family protein
MRHSRVCDEETGGLALSEQTDGVEGGVADGAARIRNVVVAYDGSAAARRALARTAELGRPDGNVTVVNVMPEVAVSARIGPPPERLRQLDALEDAQRFLAGRGIDTRTAAPIGDAASEILATAERVRADLLVIARRGGRMAHVLGSTSSHVVRAAKCDVLVVHGPSVESGGPRIGQDA